MELAAAGAVDELTADDVDTGDDEADKMSELVEEGMIDEIDVEEGDMVVLVLALVPQKRPRKQTAGAILPIDITSV